MAKVLKFPAKEQTTVHVLANAYAEYLKTAVNVPERFDNSK